MREFNQIEEIKHNGFDVSFREVFRGKSDCRYYSIRFKKDEEWIRKGVSVPKYKIKDGIQAKFMEAEAKHKLLKWIDTL